MSSTDVIVVNFNGGELLVDCVNSLLLSSVQVQVFVSDNGSSDGSIERLEQQIDDGRLHIILNQANLGFARASNLALEQTSADYILFLNPDCWVEPNTIEHMMKVMEANPDVGMASCLLLNPDGTEQAGCRRQVPTPARALIRMLYLDKPFPFLKEKGILLHQQPLPDTPEEMEAISGAFMMVRREALNDVGPMDEQYFLHCEDLDWCMRFRQRQWRILFVPDVVAYHEKGVCSRKRPVRVEWHKHRGMVRFYRKFFQHQYPAVLMWMVITAVWLRFGLIAVLVTVRRLLS